MWLVRFIHVNLRYSIVEHGRHARGETAASALLEGFEVEVSAVFDAPETGG